MKQLLYLQSILETLVEFDETGDFTRTWEAIIRDAVHLMGASRGTLFLVDRGQNLLVPRVWFGLPWQGKGMPRPYHWAEGIAGRAWQTGRLQVIEDVRQADEFRPSHSPLQAGLRSILCVPIRAREHVIGVIAVDSPKANAFKKEDQQLLAILARHVAQAWEQAKFFDGLKEMSQVGHRLNNLGGSGNYRKMLREIAERALQVVAAGTENRGEASVVLYRYDETVQQFDDQTRVGIGFKTGADIVPGKPRPHGIGMRAIQRKKRVISYEEKISLHPTLEDDNIHSMVCYPLLVAGKTLGVLYISLRDPRPFTQQELLLLDNFVNQAALAFYYIEQTVQAERALAVSETFAAIGDVAANLMHRINNQVGTIPVRIQSIQYKSPIAQNDPYVARHLAAIEKSARSAMDTVRETVRHLKPIEFTSVHVSDAVQGALQEASLPETVLIQTEGIHELPPTRVGAPQLQLIFLNLFENASEAMNAHGAITIQGATQEQFVIVTVSDTGPGIPDSLLNRIFELNVSSGSERKLGFGLWWVRSNLHRCGGDITIESLPDEPASFRLQLPRWEKPR